jgi:hypothetical protein
VLSGKCQREGGKECQELGPRIFLTLPKVDSGKVHDLRGKNNSTRIEGHFSIELYSQEATHHIPHHSRQVPRVNWDTILSSPKKKKKKSAHFRHFCRTCHKLQIYFDNDR